MDLLGDEIDLQKDNEIDYSQLSDEELFAASMASAASVNNVNDGEDPSVGASEEPKEQVLEESLVPSLNLEEVAEEIEEESLEDDSDELIREFSDRIIGTLYASGEEYDEVRKMLFGVVRPDIFRDENYVLYRVLLSVRDKHFVPDDEFVKIYLTHNVNLLKEAHGKFIDVTSYGQLEDSNEMGYTSGVLKHLRRLRGIEPLQKESFYQEFEKYKILFQSLEAERLLLKAVDILSGEDKKYSGFQDASEYVMRGLNDIVGLVDSNQGSGFLSIDDIVSDNSKTPEMFRICGFHGIPELDELYGGVYSSLLYTVMGATKGGKSKFTTRMAHTALMEGHNVTVWAPEGGPEMWLAQIRAIHFDYLREDRGPVRVPTGVSQGSILKKDLNDKIRSREQVTLMDLKSNPEYGKLDFIDRPFTLESFIDTLDISVKSNKSSMVIIDYMQLLSSSNNRLSKREILSEAYPKLLTYAKTNNVAIVSPAQINQETVKELSKSGASEMRTAAGESSEIIRSSDVILALWSSPSDLLEDRSTLKSIPSRISRVHEDIVMHVNWEACEFNSLSE